MLKEDPHDIRGFFADDKQYKHAKTRDLPVIA
jgi:hypothetical protein